MVTADISERVAQFLQLYSTRGEKLRLGVAVSGGVDSVTLLHILHHLGHDLTVLHINHALRGFDSQKDEEFVRSLAAALNLPIEVQHGPPAPGNLEAEARRVRQAFFADKRRELNLAYIALGHTSSDQAETVLFRLLRGSGLRGLGGMSPCSAGLLRPLLTTSRDEIRAYANHHNLTWREDKSNRNLHFRRNWLRFVALPELRNRLNPNLDATLTAAAAVARDEESWWQSRIDRLLNKISHPFREGNDLVIDTRRLRRLHPALQRRVIRSALERVRGDLHSIDLAHVEAIREIALARTTGHARLQTPRADVLRSFHFLLIARPETLQLPRDYSLPVRLDEPVDLPFGDGVICVRTVEADAQNCANVEEERLVIAEKTELNCDALGSYCLGSPPGNLEIRNWQPGDSIVLAGSERPKKLKAMFQEYKVVLWERRHWPVLVAGDKIVWTRQFGAAASFVATVGSRKLFVIRYQSPKSSVNVDESKGQ